MPEGACQLLELPGLVSTAEARQPLVAPVLHFPKMQPTTNCRSEVAASGVQTRYRNVLTYLPCIPGTLHAHGAGLSYLSVGTGWASMRTMAIIPIRAQCSNSTSMLQRLS